MPTVLRNGPYRFFFYSADGHEPPHIHVARDEAIAKYWLNPIRYGGSMGFRSHELRQIQDTIGHNLQALMDAWDEYFGE